MIKYGNIISNFKNKNYFNQVLFKYNFWEKKIDKKHTFLFNIGSVFFITIFLLIIPAAIFKILIFSYLLITCMIFLFLTIVIAINNLTTRNEIKQIENLKNEFVQNLKEDQSILQDLAKLVVDEKSKSIFLYLTNIALNGENGENDSKSLEKLLELLRVHSNFVNTFAHQEKRDKVFKSLNILLDVKESLPKEIETKQRISEML